MILQHIADGILSGAVVALGAIGLSFTMKMLRFANFSHSELLTWGAYSALIFVSFFASFGGFFDQKIGAVLVRSRPVAGHGGLLCNHVCYRAFPSQICL